MRTRCLRRLPEVAAFRLAPEGLGGWGATVVEMEKPVDLMSFTAMSLRINERNLAGRGE